MILNIFLSVQIYIKNLMIETMIDLITTGSRRQRTGIHIFGRFLRYLGRTDSHVRWVPRAHVLVLHQNVGMFTGLKHKSAGLQLRVPLHVKTSQSESPTRQLRRR